MIDIPDNKSAAASRDGIEDRTPHDFRLPFLGVVERAIKRPLRATLYPLRLSLLRPLLALRFEPLAPFLVDEWLLGQRGNDYARHRRRVDGIVGLSGKRILVGGCGMAQEIESWVERRPSNVLGVDLFCYERAWGEVRQDLRHRYSGVRVDFRQMDMLQFKELEPESFDVFGTDAVLEHVRDLDALVAGVWRILRPGGIFYSTFGPLWFAWGGDHVSGYDGLRHGYNHLLLDSAPYERYVASVDSNEERAEAGRFWLEEDLFSRLTPRQYIEKLDGRGFVRRFVSLLVGTEAVRFQRAYPALWRELLSRVTNPLDLFVSGMTLIFQKPSGDWANIG